VVGSALRRVILTVTMIRSLEHSSPIALLPNELLFEIYSFLRLQTGVADEFDDVESCDDHSGEDRQWQPASSIRCCIQ